MKLTPMMEQYVGFKKQYPDKLLLFRMGDFYETFGDDAVQASKILNITLTSRDKASDPTPLAGFPHHSLEQYLAKIVKAGVCAVVVDQIEDPKLAKGVVKRAVTRVVTPGTLDGDLANSKKNQYLMACYTAKGGIGIALSDISTGEMLLAQTKLDTNTVENILNAYDPEEILLLNNEQNIKVGNRTVQILNNSLVKGDRAIDTVLGYYKAHSLDSLGVDGQTHSVIACAMVLSYIEETQKMLPEHISRPSILSLEGKMILDRATIRNLDLLSNSYSGSEQNSLLQLLDRCNTRMGKRLLYSWILNPLINKDQIEDRLNIVELFTGSYELLQSLTELLKQISDVERIVGKIGLNRANARDLRALSYSITHSHKVKLFLEKYDEINRYSKLSSLFKNDDSPLLKILTLINKSITEDPPITIMEGGIIKSGYNKDVDEIRSISGNSKDWIKEFVDNEKKRTGISTLKVSFNKVFGYYIEVSKANSDKVPADYIRKQTLVNCERFITEELKHKEEIILGAEEKVSKLEYELFTKIRGEILPLLPDVKVCANEIAKIDVLASFASVALSNSYVRATIYPLIEVTKEGKKGNGKKENGNISPITVIKGGRHPIVETLSDSHFISNDTEIGGDMYRMGIITGPNMAGKSTYIRQVALIHLMAQIGSFVPAQKAELTVADRIFSRVGAADNLAEGRSTFMVEMEEAANILNNATKNSLIVLDEVGRGTSTYDGVSIAWSLSEYIVEKIGARTLFATHYHELLQLEQKHPKLVKNYSVAVEELENSDHVTFLRKIVEGGTDKSYGIYVAKMAGLPTEVTERANVILDGFKIEKSKIVEEKPAPNEIKQLKEMLQINMFDQKESELKKILSTVDLENTTPMQALEILSKLLEKLDR